MNLRPALSLRSTFRAQLLAALLFALPLGAVSAAGVETAPATNENNPDFVAGKKAIDAKNWGAAVVSFNKVVSRDPQNADAHNYLGYAYRWQGKMDDSFKHYNKALTLDPKHRGAHEYIGIAYLKTNQPAKAREHLAQLEKICGKNCEEYQDLAKAIDGQGQTQAKW